MNELITVRFYENQEMGFEIASTCHYKPVEVSGWDVSVGDTIELHDEHGGYTFGTIDWIDPAIHEDESGQYRVANLILED